MLVFNSNFYRKKHFKPNKKITKIYAGFSERNRAQKLWG
jgi:hypothetical protein